MVIGKKIRPKPQQQSSSFKIPTVPGIKKKILDKMIIKAKMILLTGI
jgi:hypothetical protein